MKKTITLGGLCAVSLLTLAACSDDNTARTDVVLKFQPQIAGEDFRCQGDFTGMGNGPEQSYRATDFRWFISDVHLRDDQGESTAVTLDTDDRGLVYQDADHNVALLGQIDGCSGADAAPRLDVTGVAKGKNFTEACFSLGVPFALNHLDASSDDTPSPLNIPAMNWFWRGGHKFLKIDGFGEIQADQTGTAFNFHLGSTGCSNAGGTDGMGEGKDQPPSQECAFPNTPTYCFDFAEIADGTAVSIDPARVAAATNLGANTDGTPPGCMSFMNDPECVDIVPKYGLDYMLNGEMIPAQTGVLFALDDNL